MRVLRVYNLKIGVSHRKIFTGRGERIYFYRTPPLDWVPAPATPANGQSELNSAGTRRSRERYIFFIQKGQLHMTTNENSTSLYRIAFPYCLQKQSDGSYVVLSREYKPIGFSTDEFLDYGGYPIWIRFNGLKPKTIRKISVDGDPSDRAIYLYGDGSKPTQNKENMEDYLERLSVLMSLKVEWA